MPLSETQVVQLEARTDFLLSYLDPVQLALNIDARVLNDADKKEIQFENEKSGRRAALELFLDIYKTKANDLTALQDSFQLCDIWTRAEKGSEQSIQIRADVAGVTEQLDELIDKLESVEFVKTDAGEEETENENEDSNLGVDIAQHLETVTEALLKLDNKVENLENVLQDKFENTVTKMDDRVKIIEDKFEEMIAKYTSPDETLLKNAPKGSILLIGGTDLSGRLREDFDLELFVPNSPNKRGLLQLELFQQRSHHIAGNLGDCICISGGLSGGKKSLKSTELLKIGDLSLLRACPMLQPCSNMASAVFEKKLFSFGGSALGSHSLAHCQLFDPENCCWSSIKSMPSARHCASAAELNGKVFITGGCRFEPPGYVNSLYDMQIYDPETDSWAKSKSVTDENLRKLPLHSHASAAFQNCIYVAGGFSSVTESNLSQCQRFDPNSGNWQSIAELKPARSGHVLLVNGEDRLFCIGGAAQMHEEQVQWVCEYEARMDKWMVQSDLTSDRCCFAAVAL